MSGRHGVANRNRLVSEREVASRLERLQSRRDVIALADDEHRPH